MADLSPQQREIVNGARNAARLLVVGSVAALAVIVARLLGSAEEIEVGGIASPMRAAWVVFVALTIAHCFLSFFFVRSVRAYARTDPDPAARRAIFDEVKAETNPVRSWPGPGELSVSLAIMGLGSILQVRPSGFHMRPRSRFCWRLARGRSEDVGSCWRTRPTLRTCLRWHLFLPG
jgi:hypothetical protein